MTYSIIFYVKVIYLNLEKIYVRLTNQEYWKHIGNILGTQIIELQILHYDK